MPLQLGYPTITPTPLRREKPDTPPRWPKCSAQKLRHAMATAPYQAQAELLQLLRQRDAELAKLREERQHKETTIDFLKTKIVTLQNQNRAALSERPAPAVEDQSRNRTMEGVGRLESLEDLQRRLDAALQAKDKALHRQEERLERAP
eukprot:s2658_g5.t1